jgi:hypothetical protein
VEFASFQLLPLHEAPPLAAAAPLTIGIDEKGVLPSGYATRFDVLLTTAKNAPREWVTVQDPDRALEEIRQGIACAPHAAQILAQLLRLNENLSFEDSIVAESFAYSMLLGGAEFKTWRAANTSPPRERNDLPRMKLERENDTLVITLARPERRNAVDARLRDELVEALQLPAMDESIRKIELRGEGPSFSSGGDLAEFGTARDLGLAHHIRTAHSPTRDIHQLRPRVTAFMHGACIGSGIEIPLAATHVVAAPDTSFRLPEVMMGLIPGAGGTVSISRRAGRHRTCFLATTNKELDAETALQWGLVDRIDRI